MAITSHLTLSQVAKRLGVSNERVRQFVRMNRLFPERIGVMLFFPRDQVEAFAKKKRRVGRPKTAGKK